MAKVKGVYVLTSSLLNAPPLWVSNSTSLVASSKAMHAKYHISANVEKPTPIITYEGLYCLA